MTTTIVQRRGKSGQQSLWHQHSIGEWTVSGKSMRTGVENLVAIQVATGEASSINRVTSGHHQFLSGVLEWSSRVMLFSLSLITGFVVVEVGARALSCGPVSVLNLINGRCHASQC